MNYDEIRSKVLDVIYTSGILNVQIEHKVKLVALSPTTYDVTIDNFPLGVVVNVDDNNKSVELTYDSRRMKKINNSANIKKEVDSAIKDYLSGK